MPLHDLDCFRVGKTGHANDIEEVDLFGSAAGIERHLQRGLKFGIGRSDETTALAGDAQDIGVRPAIVVEVPDGVAEPGARIEAAVLALIVGKLLRRSDRSVGPTGVQPINSAIDVATPEIVRPLVGSSSIGEIPRFGQSVFAFTFKLRGTRVVLAFFA